MTEPFITLQICHKNCVETFVCNDYEYTCTFSKLRFQFDWMTHNEIFFFLFWLKKEKKKWPLLRVDAVLCKCIIPWLSLSHTVFSKLKGNFISIPDCIGAPSETSWMSRKLDPKLLCRARQSSDRKPAMKRDRQRRRQWHHNRLQAGQTSTWWTKKFCQHTSTYGRSRLDHS